VNKKKIGTRPYNALGPASSTFAVHAGCAKSKGTEWHGHVSVRARSAHDEGALIRQALDTAAHASRWKEREVDKIATTFFSKAAEQDRLHKVTTALVEHLPVDAQLYNDVMRDWGTSFDKPPEAYSLLTARQRRAQELYGHGGIFSNVTIVAAPVQVCPRRDFFSSRLGAQST